MTKIDDKYNSLLIADAHVHFWDLTLLNYPWLADVAAINRSFGLADYEAATQGIPISDMIFVQCECLPSDYQAEVDYVTALARKEPRIRAIIPYFPLEAADAEEQLLALMRNNLVKGIRRLEEEPMSLYRDPRFISNMALLNRHNLSFDLGVKAHQLPAAVHLVQAAPHNRYILDHFGKPDIKTGEFAQWRSNLSALAAYPTVYCKLSGLVTEADRETWNIADLQPYVDTALEYFGPDRLAFGGDWPVVTLASSYTRWYEAAQQLCRALAPQEMANLFYHNALDFYQISKRA
ncbi:amidohydrolase family protein [Parapedobacter sp. 10938]|uniref:amidohydrolase family protein n=1 Tax=Parapedobacter flavus TaxID=3110225 RepID=UPI002DBA7C62|nr:amidohydrolase family protein [Parapedobacter sp. 10938]MEC3881660.1 amidohydrolase family protein [Parapedobacter sp. 10938]